jgi:hypothetical protein
MNDFRARRSEPARAAVARALARDLATASGVTRTQTILGALPTDLADADLERAEFDGARADATTRWPDGFRPRGVRVE